MILGQADLVAVTDTEIHVLTEERVIEQIIFCNRTDGDVNIRLWYVAVGESVADKAAQMRDRVLPANSTLHHIEHDFTMRTGESIHAYASEDDVSVTVMGRSRV